MGKSSWIWGLTPPEYWDTESSTVQHPLCCAVTVTSGGCCAQPQGSSPKPAPVLRFLGMIQVEGITMQRKDEGQVWGLGPLLSFLIQMCYKQKATWSIYIWWLSIMIKRTARSISPAVKSSNICMCSCCLPCFLHIILGVGDYHSPALHKFYLKGINP